MSDSKADAVAGAGAQGVKNALENNNLLLPRPVLVNDSGSADSTTKAAQIIGEIGSQAGDIARTQGEIIATREANEKMSGVTQTDRDRALAELKAKDPTKQYSADDVSKQVYSNFYNQAFADSGFGTGGKVQRAISAVTAAVQGLSGGNVAQAISGASAPYLAEKIHELTENNPETQAMAHAVLGAVTSYASGNSALAGAAGGVSGELMAQLVMKQLYPGKAVGDLSETEKQTVIALGTLAAGLAGGAAGDSTADAVAGAQAGKNAVENNLLGKVLIEGCAVAAPCRTKVAEQLLEIGAKAGIAGLAGVAMKDVADKMTSDELDHLVTLEMMGNDEITGKYLSSLQDKYAPSHTGNNDAQINAGPNHTGNNAGQVDAGRNHTGNSGSQINTGPNHTGGDQSVEQLPNNTGNTEGFPDLPNYMESQGYEPNKNAVGNMGEFLKQSGFGSTVKDNTQKTNQQYQGQTIYKATDDVGNYIKKGDQFYLDGLHKDHIEVFDKRGNFRAVLNLDGSINERKTQEA